ncbi:hypothetical protein G3R49_02260 [Shewanella sp. WXL01]|uniref:hypothetical protein n=1 Tax=Shewanella sp. WXL01 TaxID=2709721 RepID=UPI0014382E55|nr:hypothetical protein [Shewanella sp. WXL01]NKF49405.1 hypothetical protein [Shewanella sp. WXL01]
MPVTLIVKSCLRVPVVSALFISAMGFSGLFYAEAALASSNQIAIDKFSLNSEPIGEQGRLLSEQHLELMESLNRDMEASPHSAIAVVNKTDFNSMAKLGEKSIATAREYLALYKTFQSELEPTSACYQAEGVVEIETMIAQRLEANQHVANIKAADFNGDEASATIALLNVQMHNSHMAMLMQMFEMVKTCFIADAMGLNPNAQQMMQGLPGMPPMPHLQEEAEEFEPEQ